MTIDSEKMNAAAYTLCACNWIFGLGVIQYPLGHRRPTISMIYSSICIIIYCSISAVAYPHMIKWSVDLGKMALSVKILFFSNIILTVSVITLARHSSERTFNTVRKAMMVHELMERIGINLNARKMKKTYRRELIRSAIVVIAFIAVNATLITMEEAPLYAKITTVISSCYPVVIMFIADTTFVIRVSGVSIKYRILNKALRIMLTDELDVPRHKRLVSHLMGEKKISKPPLDAIGYTVNDPSNVIKLTKEVHLQLLKLCEEANKTYGLQILLSIVVAFGVITGNVYVSYMILLDGEEKRNLAFKLIIKSTVWTLYYAIKISNFTQICSRCKENATETGDLLNKFYDDPFANDEVQSEIRDFNVQLIQRPLNFTAAGYFDLDTRLMQIMISSITTYLMILVQLGKGPA